MEAIHIKNPLSPTQQGMRRPLPDLLSPNRLEDGGKPPGHETPRQPKNHLKVQDEGKVFQIMQQKASNLKKTGLTPIINQGPKQEEDNNYYEKNERGFIVRGVKPSKGVPHKLITPHQKKPSNAQSPYASNRDLEIELQDHLHPIAKSGPSGHIRAFNVSHASHNSAYEEHDGHSKSFNIEHYEKHQFQKEPGALSQIQSFDEFDELNHAQSNNFNSRQTNNLNAFKSGHNSNVYPTNQSQSRSISRSNQNQKVVIDMHKNTIFGGSGEEKIETPNDIDNEFFTPQKAPKTAHGFSANIISGQRGVALKTLLDQKKLPPESISMILSGNFSMKNFLANKGKLVNGKVIPAEKTRVARRHQTHQADDMYGIRVKNVDSENASPYEMTHKLMNRANFVQMHSAQKALQGKPFRENATQVANLFQSKLLSNHSNAKRMRSSQNKTWRPDQSRMTVQQESVQNTLSDMPVKSPESLAKGRVLFVNRNSSPFQTKDLPAIQSTIISNNKAVDDQSYADKMRLVIDRHNLKIGGLKDQFETISSNFDKARTLAVESNKAYNEKAIKEFDTQLSFLEKIGVAQTRKQIKRRELQQLLNDTSGVSAQVSALTLKKFKEDMFERKQQLAFRLDKIYFLKKHSTDVFRQLLKSGQNSFFGYDGGAGPTSVQDY
ncbi:hypothetical protein FGO68_gene7735 [Halteria grandinella]|uniref:Uncharacterized protein n=1 Tax=Halteria grandinella TaxID=5974 RepID=A0A8J8SXK8_HALGN|nr:hypothetical protein FGO68_gene7735 [Halteria grandinella]